MCRPRERDARDLRRLRQGNGHIKRQGNGHIKCTCPGSNGVTRAVNCTICYGRNVCVHGRIKRQCRDCANGKPLANDRKCNICGILARNCKQRGCNPKPE